jgi:segregation and condensation protein A
VDLSRLSILDLAEQFGAALEAAVARRRVPLSALAIGWSWRRTWRCCARGSAAGGQPGRGGGPPGGGGAAPAARRPGVRPAPGRLAGAAPALGRDVFARGAAEEEPEAPSSAAPAQPAADTAALLRACLAVLERPGRGGSWRPAPLPLWRVPDALARLRRMLPTLPEGAALERFLPETAAEEPDAALRRRAALASTLLAGLEMGREGAATLSQGRAFGAIVVAPAGPLHAARGSARAEEADRAGRHGAHPVEA